MPYKNRKPAKKMSPLFTALAIGVGLAGTAAVIAGADSAYTSYYSYGGAGYKGGSQFIPNHDGDIKELTDLGPYSQEPRVTNGDMNNALDRLAANDMSSVYDLMNCKVTLPTPDDYNISLSLERSFDRAGTSEKQLCLWAAFDPLKDKYQREVLPGLNYISMNETELVTYIGFQQLYTPSEAYKSWEQGKREEAMAAILNDPEIIKAREEWKPQSAYKDADEAIQQYKLKRETFQRIADIVRGTYGLGSIPVYLYKFEVKADDGSVLGGTTSIAANNNVIKAIEINYDPAVGATDTIEDGLEAILHETKHSIDDDMIRMLVAGEMSSDDVRAGHSAAIMLNQKLYMQPENIVIELMDLEQRIFDIETKGYSDREIPLAFEVYVTQYSERSAREFAAEMDKLYRQEVETAALNTPQANVSVSYTL